MDDQELRAAERGELMKLAGAGDAGRDLRHLVRADDL
jgi:hypothetical protein